MAPTTSSNATDFDLITLGETMWRLSPPGFQRLDMARSLDVNIGGSESNLAIALARLGRRVAWWSRLPDNALGHHVAQSIHMHGVDVSGVCWQQGARLGTYFIEFGSPPRATQVIYDRANSAASQMQPDDFNWELLRQTRRLHLTGITPALSASCLETMRRAVHEARQAGTILSFDLNYRAKLWSWETCRPIMDEMASQAALVIGAVRDARSLLADDTPLHNLAHKLHERWKGATIVLTNGEAGALAFDGRQSYAIPAFRVQIVDRVGAGDAFATGLLDSLLDDKPLDEAIRAGHAAAALKMTIPGDLALVTRAEVERLLAEAPSDIQR